MRKIKYRAIPKDSFIGKETTLDTIDYFTHEESYDGTFVYGYLADGYIIGETITGSEDGYVPVFWVPIKKETIGQYTGLKDKNGKEIWEGDICKVSNDSYYTNGYWNTEEDEWELVMKVVYTGTSYSLEEIKDKYMKIFLDEAIWESMELEVIGNIYENPELLEEE